MQDVSCGFEAMELLLDFLRSDVDFPATHYGTACACCVGLSFKISAFGTGYGDHTPSVAP